MRRFILCTKSPPSPPAGSSFPGWGFLRVGHSCPPPSPATYSLAEIEEEPLKDQDGPCAAQNGEGLTSQKAKYGAGDSRAQEALQHALRRHGRGVTPAA